MANITTIAQDIINDNINRDADLDLRLLASQNRQIERKDASRKSFETAVNVLAMNTVGDRHFQRASADKRELWNGMLSHTLYKSESDRLVAQYGEKKPETPQRAVIKARKTKNGKPASAPIASYIPATPSASTTLYDSYNIYMADGKTKVYSPTINFYHILGYKVYRRAVVLEIVSADDRKVYNGFDEVITQKVSEGVDHSRDEEDKNTLTSHLVFVYEPFDKLGKPNRYDGFTQLKTWLKSMKCVTDTQPASLGDALKAIVGQTISIPRAFSYSESSSDYSNIITKDGKHKRLASKTGKSDELTVYTVFGDFELFDRNFSDESAIEYQNISEYSDRYDLDDDGNKIPETFEVLTSETYIIGNDRASYDNRNSEVIKYDCHKELRKVRPTAPVYTHETVEPTTTDTHYSFLYMVQHLNDLIDFTDKNYRLTRKYLEVDLQNHQLIRADFDRLLEILDNFKRRGMVK